MKQLKAKFKSLIKYFNMIMNFAKNDLKKRYSGSLLGFVWAYVLPLVVILVWWFVFQVGIKNPNVGNYPFIVWLVPAYVGWTYISDTVMQSANCLYEYSYLVQGMTEFRYIRRILQIFDRNNLRHTSHPVE